MESIDIYIYTQKSQPYWGYIGIMEKKTETVRMYMYIHIQKKSFEFGTQQSENSYL